MEDWKPVLNGFYQVTSCGRVRSIRREMVRNNGRPHTIPGKELSASPDTKGYPQVTCYNNGTKGRYSVHRLVYEAHVGPISEGMVVDHIDGDRTNFHVSNLQLLTRSNNVLKQFEDAYNKGYRQALIDHGIIKKE